MAGEGETTEEITTEEHVEETATPVVDEATVQLREDKARLEGENAALRARPTEPAKPAAVQLTAAMVQKAFEDGAIDDAQRITALADLRFEEKYEQRRRVDAERESLRVAEETLDGYVTDYPERGQKGSQLLAKVQTELRALRARDPRIDPDDIRHQLLAVERVVGGHKLGGGSVAPSPPHREFERVRRPTGGFGGGAPTPERQKDDPPGKKWFDAMTPEAQAEMVGFRGSKEAAIKTLGHATDGSIAAMRKNGRFKTA
jgi:hypothetical protein